MLQVYHSPPHLTGPQMCKECEQSMTRGGRRTTSIAGRCSACDKRSDDMVYGFDLGVECYVSFPSMT